MVFALAGNQNCGKTTLFNQLTGSNQHVGNFPGVTVDSKSGELRGAKGCSVVDLPGMIGWVGLVIPHICRLLVGQNTRHLLPCSMLLGASFLMLVDDLARCLTTSEIPLGILTALVGAPLFLYLIVKGGARDAA